MSKRLAGKPVEIEDPRRRLEAEKARVHALSRELAATRRMLNTLLGRDDPSQCDLRTVSSTLEKQAIETALLDLKGNITATARKLGMSRQSLYTKIRTCDVELDSKRTCPKKCRSGFCRDHVAPPTRVKLRAATAPVVSGSAAAPRGCARAPGSCSHAGSFHPSRNPPG